MARRINRKCQHCGTLSIAEAIALHGSADDPDTLSEAEAIAQYGRKGERCWNAATCHRKRSHYRHREDNNRIRRRQRRDNQRQEANTTSEIGYGEISCGEISCGEINSSDSGNVTANPSGILPVPATAADPDSYLELLPAPALRYAAVLVLYRSRKDAPVHAIAAEIWQGSTKVHNIKAVHCAGMRGNEVADYIEKMLEQLHEQFGVSRFEAEPKELPVANCPLTPCPLKPS